MKTEQQIIQPVKPQIIIIDSIGGGDNWMWTGVLVPLIIAYLSYKKAKGGKKR